MAKEEKAKKAGKASSSGSDAVAGGASGDWISSRFLARRLEELVEKVMILHEGWDLPSAGEVEPPP